MTRALSWIGSHRRRLTGSGLVAVFGIAVAVYLAVGEDRNWWPFDDDDPIPPPNGTATPAETVATQSETPVSEIAVAIRVGMSVDDLEALMGEPSTRQDVSYLADRGPANATLLRTVYPKDGWYVTAVSDPTTGTVEVIWITSCDPDLRLRFEVFAAAVELWTDSADALGSTEPHYNAPGNGQEPVWSEVVPAVGATGFRSAALSVTTYCSEGGRPIMDRALLDSLPLGSTFEVRLADLSPAQAAALASERARMPVNAVGWSTAAGGRYLLGGQIILREDASLAGVW
jgi:hypothetical protein